MLSHSSDPRRWRCSGLQNADCRCINHCLLVWRVSIDSVWLELLLPTPLHFQKFYLFSHDRTYHCGGNLRAGIEKDDRDWRGSKPDSYTRGSGFKTMPVDLLNWLKPPLFYSGISEKHRVIQIPFLCAFFTIRQSLILYQLPLAFFEGGGDYFSLSA
jgi:hypothetical protein